MKKTILLLFFLLMGIVPSMAQVDTVVAINHSTAVGKVEELPASWSRMKMQRLGAPEGKSLSCRMKELSYIRFADGFRMDFVGGRPVRDNLLSCPTMVTEDNKILAEGLVRLNNEELKVLLGDRTYTLGYRPASTVFTVGALQCGIGVAEFISKAGFFAFKFERIRNEYYSYDGFPGFIFAYDYFYASMAIAGLVSMSMGRQGVRDALAQRDRMDFISRDQAKKEFWWGLAGTGAGLGLVALGCYDWDKNNRAKAERFPAESIVMMAGGALLANISASFAVRGGVHMLAHSRYNAKVTIAPNGVVVNF